MNRALLLMLTLALVAAPLTGCLGSESLGFTSSEPPQGRLLVAVQPVPYDGLTNLSVVFSEVTVATQAQLEAAVDNATAPDAGDSSGDASGDGHDHAHGDDGHDHTHRALAPGLEDLLGPAGDHGGEDHTAGDGDGKALTTGAQPAYLVGDGAPVVLADVERAPGEVAGFLFTITDAVAKDGDGQVPVRLTHQTFALPHNIPVTAGQTTAVTFTMDLARGLKEDGGGYALDPRPGVVVVAVDGDVVAEVDVGQILAREEAERLKEQPLTAPTVRVTNATGAETTTAFAGDALTLEAVYPEGSEAAERVANYIWELGDGNVKDGRKVTHKYNAPGLVTATLTVEDNLGREATTEVVLDIAMRKAYEGAVFAGTGGQDAVEGRDHHDHELELPEGAQRVRLVLAFDASTENPATGDEAVANNLFLTVTSGGEEVASATDDANPKVIELSAADAGDALTLRVSGDQGVGVGYALTAEVFFQ